MECTHFRSATTFQYFRKPIFLAAEFDIITYQCPRTYAGYVVVRDSKQEIGEQESNFGRDRYVLFSHKYHYEMSELITPDANYGLNNRADCNLSQSVASQ